MKRREFLVRAGQTVIAIPMVLTAVSCGDDSGPGAPENPDEFTRTSSVDSDHSHRLTLTCADLSAGATDYNSGSGGGHIHPVKLGMGDAARFLNGESIMAATTLADRTGHTHTWTLQKPANVCV